MRKRILILLCIAISLLLFSGCAIFLGDDDNNTKSYDLSDPLIGYRLTSDPDPVYDGTPKTRSFVLTYDGGRIDTVTAGEEHSDLNAEYRDNVNAGTATILVTAKSSSEKYKGSLTVEFPILPDPEPVSVNDVRSLNAALSSGNFLTAQLSSDIVIGAEETLTIPQGITLLTNGYSLRNLGTLNNLGTLTFSATDEGNESSNEGSFSNLGNLYFKDETIFFNDGTFENNGNVDVGKGTAGIYSSTDISGKTFDGYYRRYPLSECEIVLSFYSAPYTGSPLTPFVTVFFGENEISTNGCEIVYSDNINAGTATVTLTAERLSRSLIGQNSVAFTIERTQTTAHSQQELFTALENGNYDKIICYFSTLSADITVPADTTLTLCYDLRSSGNWTVEGSLITESGISWTHSGQLNIHGDVSLNGNTNLKCETVITGTLKSSAPLYQENSLINRGTLDITGNFYNIGNLTNSGNAANSGKFYQYPDGSLTSDKPFVNTGTAYLDEINSAFSDGYIIRERLNENNVSLDNDEFVFDGTEQTPAVRFGDGTVYTPYSVIYSYYPEEMREENPVRAGTVYMTVTVKGNSEYYCGSVTLSYRILRASALFNDTTELKAILENTNYDTAIAAENIRLEEDITVAEDYTLVIPQSFDLVNTAVLTVNGKAEIGGRFANVGDQSSLTIAENGSFRVDGSAYFNETRPAFVTGNGTIYLRTPLSDLTAVDLPESVIYSAEGTPKPEICFSDVGYIPEYGIDYYTQYRNASDATLQGEPAEAISFAFDFSTRYYGSRTDTYTILPAEISVSTFEQLLNAVNSHRSDADFGNYSLITLTQSILHENDALEDITLRIAENTTLALGENALNLRDGGAPYNKKHYIVNNGTMRFGYKTTLLIDLRYSGTGIIVCETDNAQVAEDMASLAHIVRLTGNITEELTIIPYRSDVFTFDLNGYSVSRLRVALSDDLSLPAPTLFEIISSRAGGTLGAEGNAEAGLYVASIDEDKHILVSGIEIYGVEYYKEIVKERVSIESCVVHSD